MKNENIELPLFVKKQYKYLIEKLKLDIAYKGRTLNVITSFKKNGRCMGYQWEGSEVVFDNQETHELISAKKLIVKLFLKISDNNFASFILKLNRELQNIGITQLAEAANLTKQEINRWEKGVTPSREKKEVLSEALGFSIEEFDVDYWK